MGVISSITGGLPGAGLATLSCTSVDDPACSAAQALMVAAVIPPCSSGSTVNDICISGLESAGSDGKLLPTKFILEAKSIKFPANPTYSLPAGGGVSIWRGASSDGKEIDYAISAVLRLNFYREAGKKPNALFFEFHTQITPVIIKSGNYYPKKWFTNGGRGITLGLDNPSGTQEDPYNNCLFTELGKCAMAQPFTAEQSLAIKLQMDDRLTGWLFGRMKNTAVVVKPISAQINSILVEGTSISVPAAGAWVPLAEIAKSPGLSEMDWDKGLSANKYLPKGQPASIFKSSNHPDLFEMPRFGIPIENGGGIHEPPAALKGTGMFQAVEKWLKPIGTENQTWRFDAITQSSFQLSAGEQGRKFTECFGDKDLLQGMVTTNALAYDWGPPQFIDSSLSYRVAGTHFGYDGSVFKGSYDLAIRSAAARCLYGFTSAPIDATVSVLSLDGSSQDIATQTVAEREGWLSLKARGFTFSSPTIKIKLTQAQALGVKSATKETPNVGTALPVPKKIPQRTITCKKGKLLRKITGKTPLCPKGFINQSK